MGCDQGARKSSPALPSGPSQPAAAPPSRPLAAQVHLRHLVGGRARGPDGELLHERICQVSACSTRAAGCCFSWRLACGPPGRRSPAVTHPHSPPLRPSSPGCPTPPHPTPHTPPPLRHTGGLSGAAGSASALPVGPVGPLEHHPLPLPPHRWAGFTGRTGPGACSASRRPGMRPEPRPPPLRAGNQASGVLLGIQVPPEEDAEFQAAGGRLPWGAPVAAVGSSGTATRPLPPRSLQQFGCRSEVFCPPPPPPFLLRLGRALPSRPAAPATRPPARRLFCAVAALSPDFTFTELSGKAREVFKMFIS